MTMAQQDSVDEPWVDAAWVCSHTGRADPFLWREARKPDSIFPRPAYFNGKRRWKPSWFAVFDCAITILSQPAEATRAQIETTVRELFPAADDSIIERGFRLAAKKRPELAIEPEAFAERRAKEGSHARTP